MKIDIYKDGIGFVELVSTHQDPALSVVNSARISYQKQKEEFDDKDKKLVKFLWEHNHSSPFRHHYYTFHIKAPLFVFRQLVKHQVGGAFRTFEIEGQEVSGEVFEQFFDTDKGCSWNEVSGRYVELKPEFYIPKTMRVNKKEGNKQVSYEIDDPQTNQRCIEDLKKLTEEYYENYKKLLENGLAKELARMFIPQSVYTESYWTVSLQAILHFLTLRLKPEAQHEIRWLAEGIKTLINHDLRRLDIDI